MWNSGFHAGSRSPSFLNFVIGGVIGLQHLLAPRLWTDLAGIVVEDTALWRLIGAAVLGYAAGSGLAWRLEAWRRVRVVVVMQAVWSLVGAAVIVWAISYENLPALEWLNAGVLAGFGITFAYYLVSNRNAP